MSTTTIGPPPPGAPPDDRQRIRELMEKTGEELMTAEFELTQLEQEQRRPYLYLLMNIVSRFWNGNRYGLSGDYAYRDKQRTGPGPLFNHGLEYMGHNIAAIAVDARGQVIDFDFNHNTVFKSSLEHAEARLLRRIFTLTGLRSSWSLGDAGEDVRDRYSTNLGEVTIYTSLEPCAQCAGIMALARVKEVVYLQADDGARRAANVIYNLQPYGASLRPVQAHHCGVNFGTRLAKAFDDYKAMVTDKNQRAFFKPSDASKKEERSTSLSTFLCTDAAKDIYDEGAALFSDAVAAERRARAAGRPADGTRPDLVNMGDFFDYASAGGHRGTPH